MQWLRRAVFGAVISLFLTACDGSIVDPFSAPPEALPEPQNPDSAAGEVPDLFEAVSPARAAAKVKYLVNGLPLTATELSAVTHDAGALEGLVQSWLAPPEGQEKLLGFFINAFQQSLPNGNLSGLTDQLGNVNLRNADPRLAANLRESFARTVLALMAEGRPFTEALTTRRFMMTPALAAFYALLDTRHVDDNFKVNDRLKARLRSRGMTSPQLVVQTTTPVPLAESINPASPNFMRWHLPGFPKGFTNCPVSTTDSRPRTERVFVARASAVELFNILNGGINNEEDRTNLADGTCNAFNGRRQFTDADFTSWRLVTVRAPKPGESPTELYDLPRLRTASELVLDIPRIGFFSTPAFFANWSTNDSNQARVLANQALIVAIGHSIEPSGATLPLEDPPSLDKAHASPTSVCYGCHAILDPMRQVFRRTYSYAQHEQLAAEAARESSHFSFAGHSAATNDIEAYAQTLATHPLLAQAWTQKLCYYANSGPCSLTDPEFRRVVEVFRGSGFDFSRLVRALFSSPLVTGLTRTDTVAEGGESVSIARRDHLCTALTARLNALSDPPGRLADVCTFDPTALALSKMFPQDSFSRGSEVPLHVSDTSLFFRSGTEHLCQVIAGAVVDAGASPLFTSARPEEALARLVEGVMGLPGNHPLTPASLRILQEHFEGAESEGASRTDALRSTFVLACQSPSVLTIGL